VYTKTSPRHRYGSSAIWFYVVDAAVFDPNYTLLNLYFSKANHRLDLRVYGGGGYGMRDDEVA
jgi:hypothetical protein